MWKSSVKIWMVELLKSSTEVYRGVAEGRYTVGLTFEEGGAGYVSKGATE